MKIINEVLAELKYFMIMTSLLKCHDLCHPMGEVSVPRRITWRCHSCYVDLQRCGAVTALLDIAPLSETFGQEELSTADRSKYDGGMQRHAEKGIERPSNFTLRL